MLLGRKKKRPHTDARGVVLRKVKSTQPPTSQPPTSVVHQRRRGQPREIALHIGGKAVAQPTRRDANPICKEDPEICFFTAQPSSGQAILHCLGFVVSDFLLL
ncbi:hypothetical protein SLEP1_g31548 [Rubroshorea leprosula]|uniref:Uncharacterized protein n=1 Tax=Rubroshorea leprosula TaxID=152421 RepID=A0AAV5K3N4_9ROSI|nr:hypothetical protein SLEP1_g31548 [Rubroshorea leprosula]